MSNKALYILWGGLYILCTALGFIPSAEGAAANAMTLLSIGFFVPGFLLLHRGQRRPILMICAISLGLTLVCLVLNVWSVALSELDGQLLYALLGLVSGPMYCSRMWLLSLFLWACLLMAAVFQKKPEA